MNDDTDRDFKLLTVDELGQRLGMTKGALYNLVYTRQIPFVKIGRRVRFNAEDIKTWLGNLKVPPREI